MRDQQHHYSPLQYMLEKYQQNLYLDHQQQHYHNSFNHSFQRERRPPHEEEYHYSPPLDNHLHHNRHQQHFDSEEDDRASLHSHSSFTSSRSMNTSTKRTSPRLANYEREDCKSDSLLYGTSPTRSEAFLPNIYKEKRNSVRQIPIHDKTQQHGTHPSNNSHTSSEKSVKLKDYMKRNGLRMVEAQSNGNCLFNSISLALFDSENKNYQLRKLCVDWIEENLDTAIKDGIKIRDLIFLKPEQSSIADYLHDMRQEKEWADYCCLNALSNLLECELEVIYVNYENGEWLVKSEIQVFPINHLTSLPKIRLMYIEDLKHYNLLIKSK